MLVGDIIKEIKEYYIKKRNVYCIRIVRKLIPKNSLRNNQLHFYLYQMEMEQRQPPPKEIIKKIRTISKEVLKKYWWLILLFYTLKGIAVLLLIHFIINA